MSEPPATERLVTASHESGHCTAAHLLGRLVSIISLDGPFGGPCVVDRHPYEGLGRGRPQPDWYIGETDITISMAGPLCERFAAQIAGGDVPPLRLPATPERVAEAEPPAEVEEPEPTPVIWQPFDSPPSWPQQPLSDRSQCEYIARSITTSEREAEALLFALRLRTAALTDHPHFRFVHAHMARALLRDGELTGADCRRELQRAELAYSRQALATTPPQEEDIDDP